MRTLRDEWKRLLGENYVCGWPATFFDEYGSYRVVEGVLRVEWRREENKTMVWVDAGDGDLAHRHVVEVGRTGARVKLLLPPEEKEGDSLNRKLLQAQSDKRDAQHRADRYEKALQEIYRNWRGVSDAAGIAKGALDENA